jgi:SAM-dependent methyltransferase
MSAVAGNESATGDMAAPGIGAEIRRAVFRDTRTFYEAGTVEPAPRLLAFARQHAGRAILDLGCATGGYCVALARHGFEVAGADTNAAYVRIARERGVAAHHVSGALPFGDASFDTVLLFEVLEHVREHDVILREARRVARKNVLITVPNCEGHEELRQRGLLLEHFADLDHRHFFTRESLQELLAGHYPRVVVKRGDPINPLALVGTRWLRRIAGAAWRLKLIRPRFHFRLYAVASV